MRFLALAVVMTVNLAWASDLVCVRNYVGDDPNSPCVRFPTTYTFVVPAEGEKKICARMYPEFECGALKEYEFVKATRGGRICTLNYHQPPVSRLCDDAPDYYDWVQSSDGE